MKTVKCDSCGKTLNESINRKECIEVLFDHSDAAGLDLCEKCATKLRGFAVSGIMSGKIFDEDDNLPLKERIRVLLTGKLPLVYAVRWTDLGDRASIDASLEDKDKYDCEHSKGIDWPF